MSDGPHTTPSSSLPPTPGYEAIEKVLRVHSGEDFAADDFPTLEDGQAAWAAWRSIDLLAQAALRALEASRG